MERYKVDKLEQYVRSQLAGRVRDLRLLLRDNGLVMQGLSHSYHAKRLAQHFVVEGTHLPLLANDIKVSR